jgi:hypothetical protein
LKPRNTQDHSGFSRKGGEEMKRKSKGNFFNFIEDASKKNSPMWKQTLNVLKRKGLTSEQLLKLFQDRGYDGVSLRDCRRILNIIKDPSQLDHLEKEILQY